MKNSGPNTAPKAPTFPELSDHRWKDPYEIFGITRGAPLPTPEELRQKQRTFLKRYHPDTIQDPDPKKQEELRALATEKLKRINLAYDLFRNPDQLRAFNSGLVDLFGTSIKTYSSQPRPRQQDPGTKNESTFSFEKEFAQVQELYRAFRATFPKVIEIVQGATVTRLKSNMVVPRTFTFFVNMSHTLSVLRGKIPEGDKRINLEALQDDILNDVQTLTTHYLGNLSMFKPGDAIDVYKRTRLVIPRPPSIIAYRIIEKLDLQFKQAYIKTLKKASKKDLRSTVEYIDLLKSKDVHFSDLLAFCKTEAEKRNKEKWF